MRTMIDKSAPLDELRQQIKGQLHTGDLHRRMYATDASIYRRLPTAVAIARSVDDLQSIVRFAAEHRIGLIPRTAGTSLAGQCVGDGIVVDVSKHFGRILEFDQQSQTVTLEPGVIRDDLNRFLRPHGVFFSPNTSTSNRCMIGGMVGNNSCGSTSIRYGSTRDKIVSVDGLLSDGSAATFGPIDAPEFARRQNGDDRYAEILRCIDRELSPPAVHRQIRDGFADPSVTRRNTGYALDSLIDCGVLGGGTGPLNLARLLCGSEGTLAMTTAVTLRVDPLPPPERIMVVAHFATINGCVAAAAPAMRHRLLACEMIDRTILNMTRNNRRQANNRRLIDGDPAGVLLLELAADDADAAAQSAGRLVQTLENETESYANVVLTGDQITRVMDLRRSGLGLLGNMVGDAKAVACIEDTAVPLSHLADYIAEFTTLMCDADQQPVYYAHAGAGELHLRPVLNLKRTDDVRRMVELTDAVAKLVRRYGGTMSGEHGDGIVRSKYIPTMVGEANYQIMHRIKRAFDPHNIFNPGKIIEPWPMDRQLRHRPSPVRQTELPTVMRFDQAGGILRHAEKCNGSGDCLKPLAAGGGMCPSYRVTGREQDSTRGRANVLREAIVLGGDNPFDDPSLAEAMELCISCKACRRECPSTVDMAALKSEVDHQRSKTHGHSLRSRLFAHNHTVNQWARVMMPISGAILRSPWSSGLIKRLLRIAPNRSLPALSPQTCRAWCDRHLPDCQPASPIRMVTLMIDELTDQLDAPIGIDAIGLLTGLGYGVRLADGGQSGRAMISKGFLPQAKRLIHDNVRRLDRQLGGDDVLVGIEPSAVLTLRDESLRLAGDRDAAARVARRTKLIDEFLADEFAAGRISADSFDDRPRRILVHGHCHQKALSDVSATVTALSIPVGHTAELIPSGCCGMAGSFGYEAEHYRISMAMAETALLPAVRSADAQTIIAATGTSCRTQIIDATRRNAVHPVSVLCGALDKTTTSVR